MAISPQAWANIHRVAFDYEEETEKLLARLRPTAEELRLCQEAATRYGLKDPSPDQVLGRRNRPGLLSLVFLIAKSYENPLGGAEL